jgi:hypothetical protein
MARIESQALGGFFKTQDAVRPLVYRRFALQAEPGKYCVLDPCAGEGEAVSELVSAVFGTAATHGYKPAKGTRAEGVDVSLVAVELEAERKERCASAARSVVSYSSAEVLHGDGLHCDASGDGASILWLNPPYDFFRGQRFEARFLDKWTPHIAIRGQLVLIVPERALPYLAATLTTWFDDLEVLRYPEPEYSEFQQVVVLGRKRAIASDPGPLPELGALADAPAALRAVPPGALKVDVNRLDVGALLGGTASWCGAAGYDRPARAPRVGLAMRPRPAHVAMALGSGVFNGVRLSAPGRHDLLAKAVFHREFVDGDAKKDEHGEVVKLTQVERPRLLLTTLDLATGEYAELQPGTEPSGGGEVKNFADLLLAYGDGMVAAMRERCPSLHEGQEDVALPPMRRALYPAQASAARAALKLVHRGQTSLILGEIGSGKSCTAIQVAWALHHGVDVRQFAPCDEGAFSPLRPVPRVRRVLVVCPPHLVQNWADELRACLPDVPALVAEKPSDLDRAAAHPAPLLFVLMSREVAKLGHAVEGVRAGWAHPKLASRRAQCPKCGTAVVEGAEKLASSRAACESQVLMAKNRFARLALDMRALHRRGAKWNTDAYAVFRRASIVPLLKYLAAGTTRLKERWSSKRDMLSSEQCGVLVAALKLCAPDPRVLRILRRIYPPQPRYGTPAGELFESSMLQDFAHAVDDAALYKVLWSLGKFEVKECGEFLHQAVPAPRRYPLADYVCRKHPRLFQLLIADEVHEAQSDGAAQERALHRLSEKIPICLPLTGSLMNGYAKSLFRNMWAFSRKVRDEFAYSDATRFSKLYGYQKRVLTGDALKKAKVTEYGSSTDRVAKTEGGERLSDAPGVLPSFVLHYVLPLSVTLHKRDITPDDRVVDHDRQTVAADAASEANAQRLGAKLIEAVKRDRFDEKLAGKLFGQLAEYPSYYDRASADTGNTPEGDFQIRYPADVGGDLVASAAGLDSAQLLEKESWLSRVLTTELAEGRNVLIFLWHKELAPRLCRIVREVTGEAPAFLDAGKVQAKKRQDWIDKNVVGKKRVLITNPSCVQTGLNNLIWFSTAVFFENPGCNPFVARQATGRLDRITQTKDVRIYWPVYAGVQEKLLDLLQSKMAISQQIDGIDPTAALEMAGAGEAQVQAQDVGLAIYKYLGGE